MTRPELITTLYNDLHAALRAHADRGGDLVALAAVIAQLLGSVTAVNIADPVQRIRYLETLIVNTINAAEEEAEEMRVAASPPTSEARH